MGQGKGTETHILYVYEIITALDNNSFLISSVFSFKK